MLHALIGHRGVGKTSLLRRIAGYYAAAGRPVRTLDLDQIVAERAGQPLARLFSERGEAHFRELEAAALAAVVTETAAEAKAADVYIAVGAGFSGKLPEGVNPVWIRRTTDGHGRIFVGTERPRLNSALSPLAEYLERYPVREKRYAESCREVWTLLEGLEQPDEIEREFLMSALAAPSIAPQQPIGGILSLLPSDFRTAGGRGFGDWLGRRLAWPGVRFELRDDLLDEDQLGQALSLVPPDRRVYSFRRAAPGPQALRRAGDGGGAWDYPLELGLAQAPSQPPILSLHERLAGESVEAAGERLTAAGERLRAGILKLAIEIFDFAELWAGWQWAQAEPSRRAFLPRSPQAQLGRWRWFRALTGRTSPLAFFREGDGTSPDQPLLAEWWAAAATGAAGFAAVLGDPVEHSRTPMEHGPFFRTRRLPVLAVPLSEAEWAAGGFAVLERLGLRYAAVTAPLKRLAALLTASPSQSSSASDVTAEAVNTLYYCPTRQRWRGANTDVIGLETLLGPIKLEPEVAVWGGGGTLASISAVLPQARCFSARTGMPREGRVDPTWRPAALVWAASGRPSGWPDAAWTPRTVFDLNYAEHSAGREYATRVGAYYVSGLAMFQAQAVGQRAFFCAAETQTQAEEPTS